MTTENIPIGTKRHSVRAWVRHDGRWVYAIIAFRRDRFKRSGRVGWRKLGFECLTMEERAFTDRKAALSAARQEIKQLQKP